MCPHLGVGWSGTQRRGGVAHIPGQNHSASARVSSYSSFRRSTPQVQVGCSQPCPLQEQAQQSRATSAGRTDQKRLPLGVVLPEPTGGGQVLCSSSRHTLNVPAPSSTPFPRGAELSRSGPPELAGADSNSLPLRWCQQACRRMEGGILPLSAIAGTVFTGQIGVSP